MKIEYLQDKDIFRLEINGNAVFYSDYNNIYSKYLSDVRVSELLDDPSADSTFILKILPSNVCNMTCKYCYSENDRDKSELLEFSIIKETLMSIIKYADDNISIIFTGGGEPTINIELIKNVIALNSMGKQISYSITTNGLFQERMLQMLIENNFRVAVSIDGDFETSKNQQGDLFTEYEYNQILNNAIALNNSGIETTILVVISKLNIERFNLDENIGVKVLDYFNNLGFKKIMVSLDDAIFYENTDEDFLLRLVQLFENIVNWKIQHDDCFVYSKHVYSNYRNFKIGAFCRGLSRFSNSITILPSGTFSICHRIQDDSLSFNSLEKNDIDEFLSSDKVKRIIAETIQKKSSCKCCIARQICMGEMCPAFFLNTEDSKYRNFCYNNIRIRESLLERFICIN